MRLHTIRYRVTQQARDEHERLLAELLGALERAPVAGLRYDVFRVGDGLDFVHLVGFAKDDHGRLQRPQALKDFHTDLRERCDGEPQREELEAVGSAHADDPRGGHHDAWGKLHG